MPAPASNPGPMHDPPFDPFRPATWSALHEHPAVEDAETFHAWYIHVLPRTPAAFGRVRAAADLALFRAAAASIRAALPAVILELEVLDDFTALLTARGYRRADGPGFEAVVYTDHPEEPNRDPLPNWHEAVAPPVLPATAPPYDRCLWLIEPETDEEGWWLRPGAEVGLVLAAALDGEPVGPLGAVREDEAFT